jgi:hypothetical protein
MIDYVEGLLDIRERLKAAEKALLQKSHREAVLLLRDIHRISHATEEQIKQQFPREFGR